MCFEAAVQNCLVLCCILCYLVRDNRPTFITNSNSKEKEFQKYTYLQLDRYLQKSDMLTAKQRHKNREIETETESKSRKRDGGQIQKLIQEQLRPAPARSTSVRERSHEYPVQDGTARTEIKIIEKRQKNK